MLGTLTKPQNSPEKNSFKRTTKHPNSKSHEGEGPAKSDENLVHQKKRFDLLKVGEGRSKNAKYKGQRSDNDQLFKKTSQKKHTQKQDQQ